jgi:uncharacterized protein (TIGR02594 family)
MPIILTPQTPKHLAIAALYLGQREVKATPNDSPWIAAMLAKLNASWLRGLPWCGTFIARVMAESGLSYPKAYYRALDWSTWGEPCATPHLGCVVVLKRKGGGHVALCAGIDEFGRIVILGGNQGNAVTLEAINPSDIYAYRGVPDNKQKVALTKYMSEFVSASNAATTGQYA